MSKDMTRVDPSDVYLAALLVATAVTTDSNLVQGVCLLLLVALHGVYRLAELLERRR